MDDLIAFKFEKNPNIGLHFKPAGGIFGGWKVLQGPNECQKKGKKIYFQHPEKGEVFLETKVGLDLLSPGFIFEGELVHPREPLPWYLSVFAISPMGLVITGGLLGGLFGGIGFVVSTKILHSNLPMPMKIALSFLTVLASVGAWLLTAGLISAAMS